MSNIVAMVFVWFITLLGASLGIVVAGIIGGIIGAVTNLITKFRCRMRIFNAAIFTSLLSTGFFIIVSYQQIKPLNCADGLEGLYTCSSPLLVPFWGAVIGGIFGSFVGVIIELYRQSSR